MTTMVAGAFDDFASAQAAAEELRGSGIGDGDVQITNNAENPDGEPGTSLADEAATVPGILERVASSVFNVRELDPLEGRPIDEIRVGGIVVSVTMGEQAIQVRVPGRAKVNAGDAVRIGWNKDHEHRFDSQTGGRKQ